MFNMKHCIKRTNKMKQSNCNVLLLLLLWFLLISCSNNSAKNQYLDEPTFKNDYLSLFDSTNYDLMIAIHYDNNNQCNIQIDPTGTLKINTFALKINNDNISLNRYADSFEGSFNFVEGRTYNFEITLNNQIYKTKMIMPYKISINSQIADFDSSKSYTINWDIAKNNHLQIITLLGFSTTNQVFYPKYINPQARSFTFEPNTNTSNEHITSANIENINFTIEDKILIYAKVDSYLDLIAKSATSK